MITLTVITTRGVIKLTNRRVQIADGPAIVCSAAVPDSRGTRRDDVKGGGWGGGHGEKNLVIAEERVHVCVCRKRKLVCVCRTKQVWET